MEPAMCCHEPQCPDADAVDRDAARATASHPEQGWTLLCNGVLLFDDTGELLPDGTVVAPRLAFALPRRNTSAHRPPMSAA